MNYIPPLAWAAIAVIIIITLAINFSLLILLHDRGRTKIQTHHTARTTGDLQKFQTVLRDPFHQEHQQMDELSSLVAQLKKEDATDRTHPSTDNSRSADTGGVAPDSAHPRKIE